MYLYGNNIGILLIKEKFSFPIHPKTTGVPNYSGLDLEAWVYSSVTPNSLTHDFRQQAQTEGVGK